MALMRGMVIALCALVWTAPAAAAGGWVYDASGDVSIAVAKETARRAVKNDAIVSDTVITTAGKSYAVLKFEDGQVVAMQPNSSLHVREYRYEPRQMEKSNILFSMLKGGMRFVTGLVGQHNKEAFSLSTSNATIGIRGTEFMVVMGNSPMYGHVVSGSISMTNPAGTTVFGSGQYAVVASATTLPAAISAAALPAGTFTQLDAIPVPPASPSPAPAGGAARGGATGGSTADTTAGAATGVSGTTIVIGIGVAAGIAAAANNSSATTQH